LRSLARGLPALAVLLALIFGGQARAQNPSPEELARRHHERGTTHYNLGQFEEAISEFRKGYEQKADPVFLLNIGESYRQLGAHEKALFFYRRYLSAVPDAPNRADIDEKITTLERLVDAQQRARSPGSQPLPPHLTGVTPDRPAPGELELVTHPPPPPGPLWHRWWFWAGVGGVVAGGIAVGLLVSSARQPKPPATDLGTMRFF
jgi:tetratricopeptide (TPR) repeat protein